MTCPPDEQSKPQPEDKQAAWNALHEAYLACMNNEPGWADRWHAALAALETLL